MTEHTETLVEPLPADPLAVVREWLAQAQAAHTQPNPNSMVLATSSRDGRPSARVVLCKDVVPQPGYIVFYTNYLSAKGRQLKDNPRAAAVMHWDALHRQVRIEGPVVLAPGEDSNAYFATRMWLLARTDREAPRHHGISAFILDLKTPGVTVRPIREITGKGYKYLRPGIETTFYDARCVQVIDPFGNRIRFNEDKKTGETKGGS